jgi:hypothetical protein
MFTPTRLQKTGNPCIIYNILYDNDNVGLRLVIRRRCTNPGVSCSEGATFLCFSFSFSIVELILGLGLGMTTGKASSWRGWITLSLQKNRSNGFAAESNGEIKE